MKLKAAVTSLIAAASFGAAAQSVEPKFHTVEIDNKIQIGYGVATADVDGDGKPDIVLADKSQIVWYRNPTWQKFVLAENLTKLDNVCIAARDIDGDGKAEVAAGAGWNPGDTKTSGALFYLRAPADRTRKWEPIPLPHVPTIHRIRWVPSPDGKFDLISVPLHGYGNKDGQGEGVPIMSYRRPEDPQAPWVANVLVKQWHKTHNFDVQDADLWIAAKEGVFRLVRSVSDSRVIPIGTNNIGGVGEIRVGRFGNDVAFAAAVEPMHGTNLVVFTRPSDADSFWKRQVLDSALADGHALGCADFVGLGRDQIVVGWRAMGNSSARVGIKLFIPANSKLTEWRSSIIDDNGMACEDLCIADVDGNGKPDVVAAGRSTKNVRIYFNNMDK